jgi:hypothetical protein
VRNLNARPLLSRQAILDTISNHPELSETDLTDAIERVRFTPAAMSLDELSKLWSIFFQTPHALSMVYHANVVLIEAQESGPSALPVLQRGQQDRGLEAVLDARTPFPELENIHVGITSDIDQIPLPRSYPAAQLGSMLILRGRNFSGDVVEVEFTHARYSEPDHPKFLAPKKISVPITDRTATEIRVAIPDDANAQTEWRAGPYTVSIIVSSGGELHLTNTQPLLMAPKVTNISPASPIARDANGNVTLTLAASPQVLTTQSATMLLADREVAVTPRVADTDPLQFLIEDAPVLTDAVVRLRVDGVDSMPFKRIDTPPPTRFEFDANQRVTIT